jgi:hypothetical protein
MKNSILKGLIMGIIGILGAAFSDMETLNVIYLGLVTVLFTAQYLVKNWLMPSISDKLSVDVRDMISGLFAALFMGVSVYAASLLAGVDFTWLALWKAISVAVVGYFVKTVPSAAKK